MKTKKTIIALFIILCLFGYFIGVFVNATFDISKWGEMSRVIIAIFWLVPSLITCIGMYIINEIE